MYGLLHGVEQAPVRDPLPVQPGQNDGASAHVHPHFQAEELLWPAQFTVFTDKILNRTVNRPYFDTLFSENSLFL